MTDDLLRVRTLSAICDMHKHVDYKVSCEKMASIANGMGSLGISTGSRSPILAGGPLLESSDALGSIVTP